jgi:hypothetical protein
MFGEYILAAMERATYEIIDDPKPYYGEVPELQGVWSTGKTLDECSRTGRDAHSQSSWRQYQCGSIAEDSEASWNQS